MPAGGRQAVGWAEVAHRAGLDGTAWMRNRCNHTVAIVQFGDRVEPASAGNRLFQAMSLNASENTAGAKEKSLAPAVF